MATSSKFDLSSDSGDRLYTNGQRGSHLAAQFDRSGCFRETMENPILSSLPNMTRSISLAAPEDVLNFFQCLRFDPKDVVAQYKSCRQVDFKKLMTIPLGISVDEFQSSSSKGKVVIDDIKRFKASLKDSSFKASLKDSSVKARERMKIFNEALSVFNKFFPSMPSKKRSRADNISNDRTSALLSSDRSVQGPSLGKMAIQNHSVTSVFELEQQKLEERTKNAVPNKRTRTSLMDVRSNAPTRQSGALDRDREMLRLGSSGAVQSDDRTLSIGVDGWEKTKMKKKRSGIKPDVASTTLPTKPNDGYREPKQGIQQRPAADARLRPNSDSHGFRPGLANGAVGVGKSDAVSQPTGFSGRSSIPRIEMDNSCAPNDRRERPIGSDKERVNLKAVNKVNVRDDFNSASPTSNTKMSAPIRAPRSSTGVVPKLSPVVHRATAPNDWEVANSTNKPPTVGANNRKRTASTRSSSPPVAHWAGQRPQKISRTARRTNFIPIVPNNDENSALDTVSDVSGNEIGIGFPRRLSGNSPQQVKLKGDPLSLAALSESEESGAPEIKSKERGKKSEEMDEKAGHNMQKVSALSFPSRKNKLVSGEDLGDGVRRQGRSGRGFTSTRSLMPMPVEKLGNVGTAKQLRSAKLGYEKNESKGGRPPTRKLSDRKACTRQKHTTVNSAADFLVGSDDGHEELLAAASAATELSFSSSFWRQMEPFFGFISDADIARWKQLGELGSAPSPTSAPSDVNNCTSHDGNNGLIEHESELRFDAEMRDIELLSVQLGVGGCGTSLCQRLLSAMIPEDNCICETDEDLEFDGYGTGFELDGELGSNGLSHMDNFLFSGHGSFNGYKVPGKPEHDDADTDVLRILGNGVHPDQELIQEKVSSELQYDDMLIDDKIRLELQSLGIFLETTHNMQMQGGGISVDIGKLEEEHHEQVLKKKGLLDKLLKSASEMKDLQEKEFERCAYDKLVTMAYKKYLACRGSNSTGGKSSSNKMVKQAALAFVKRTLDRCHRFEDTGKSCFNEPLFKDMFLSGSSHLGNALSVDTPKDGESAKPYVDTLGRSLEARVSASIGSQPSPQASRPGQEGDSCVANSSDVLSEQTTGKEDTWASRKKKELLLDDVGGNVGGPLSSNAKGKRSERDKEGGHHREVLSRNGTTKTGGRPASSNAKGERKSKTKPKQKITQLSTSVNGLVGKMPEQPKPILPTKPKSRGITANGNDKEKDGYGLDVLDDSEAYDFTNLPGDGQDIGSWLNIDEDGLQDHDDFMGLEIPMDDLSDLNMMV